MLQKTTAQVKISKLRKRIRIVRGGTSSSKTFSIIPLLIDYAVKNPRCEISIVSETIPHLRRGAIRDFLKILEMVGMFDSNKWNKSSLTYTFSNESYIEFFSADQPQKLRGARRDVLFVNECNNIDWESYYQMAIRTRKFIYLDYNPVSEFWVDSELIGEPEAEMIVLTYKDNEALDQSIVAEIEKAREKGKTSNYWKNWFQVYGLGEIGNLQGVIFSNWQTIDKLPSEARLIGVGVDFGQRGVFVRPFVGTAQTRGHHQPGKNLGRRFWGASRCRVILRTGERFWACTQRYPAGCGRFRNFCLSGGTWHRG